MADITKLSAADLMMANGVNISGSQNKFFDRLKCTVKVHNMFLNSTSTYFTISTLRVWTPDGLEIDGSYYLQNPPSQIRYNSGNGTTPNLTSRVWKMTNNGHDFTISYSNGVWKLIKDGTITTSSGNVVVTGGQTISYYDTNSVTGNNKLMPLSGAYTEISGHTYHPLIVWSEAGEDISGIKLIIELENGDEVLSHNNHLFYGFTPYIAPGETEIRVDWGDGVIENIAASETGKVALHSYEAQVPYLAKQKFVVQVKGNCTRVVFGTNTTYATMYTTDKWWKEYNPSDPDTSNDSFYFKTCEDKGTWASGTSYKLYDIVKVGSDYYVSTKDNNTATPGGSGIANMQAWFSLIMVPYASLSNGTYTQYTYGSGEQAIVYEPNISGFIVKCYADYGGYAGAHRTICITGAPSATSAGTAFRALILPSDYQWYASRVLNCSWQWAAIGNAHDASDYNSLNDGTYMFNKCTRLCTEGLTYPIVIGGTTASTPVVISGQTYYNVTDGTQYSTSDFPALTVLPTTLGIAHAMFQDCNSNLENLDQKNVILDGTTTVSGGTYNHVASFDTLGSLPVTGFTNMNLMFNGCTAGVFGSIPNIPTTMVTGNTAFNDCISATFASLATIGNNMLHANYMFNNCESARFASMTSIGTSIVDANYMFANCVLAEYSSNFALPAALVNADHMFYSVGSDSPNSNSLNISILPHNLTDADSMFDGSNITINIDVLTGA